MSNWPNGVLQPARVFCGALVYDVMGGDGRPATITSHGIGCGSAGPLVLTAGSRPILGTVVVLATTQLAGMGSLPGFYVIGFTPIRPGLALDFLGMPGCSAYQSVDLSYFVMSSMGVMAMPLSIPNDPYLEALRVHCQSVVRDPMAGSMGLSASNGITLTLGNQ